MSFCIIPYFIRLKRKERTRIRVSRKTILCTFIFLIIGFPTISKSGHHSLIPITSTRKFVDLNGEWAFKKKGDADWQSVTLPNPTKEIGTLFYRRSFELRDDPAESQFLLVFEGINFSFRLKLNDQYISTQSHGYTSIVIAIPLNLLRFSSENVLEVEVNTELGNRTIPLRHALLSPEPVRGIFRDIYLVVMPSLAINDVKIGAEFGQDYSIAKSNCRIELAANENALIRFSSSDPAGSLLKLICLVRDETSSDRIIASVEENVRLINNQRQIEEIYFDIPNPQLWSLASPKRYIFEVLLQYDGVTVDRHMQKFGLRELKLEQNKIYLNRDQIAIKGITFLEDKRRLLSEANVIPVLLKLKSLGFNTISWYSPPPAYALTAADSLGILNHFRMPIWNVPGAVLADEEYQERAWILFAKMSNLAARHASVFALSDGQGFDAASDGTHDFLRNSPKLPDIPNSFFLTAGFRNYDDSLSKLALDFLTFDLTVHLHDDWQEWLTRWFEKGPGSPVLFSDISIPYVSSRLDSENVSLDEARQAYYLKEILTQIHNEPNLGFVLSSLNDWRISYPSMLALSGSQRRDLPIGLALFDETPRMALNMVRNMNHGTGYQFEFEQNVKDNSNTVLVLYGLAVMVAFLYYFRRDHRLRGNFIRVLSRPFGFHAELKDGRKIPWFITTIILITSVSSWGLILGGIFSFLRSNPLFDFMISQLSPLVIINWALIEMSWHSIIGIVGFSLFAALIISILGCYIFFLSLVTGRNLSARNALTLVYWESCIFIFLLPAAFIFDRLMSIPAIRLLLILLVAIFLFWYFYRVLVSIQTIFAFNSAITVVLFFGIPVLAAVLLDIVYNQAKGLNAQLGYLFHLWQIGS